MGATLFFGLTFVAIITQGAPDIEYANPQETMAEVTLDAAPDEVPRLRQSAWSFPLLADDAALVEARPDAFAAAIPAETALPPLASPTRPDPGLNQDPIRPEAPETTSRDLARLTRDSDLVQNGVQIIDQPGPRDGPVAAATAPAALPSDLDTEPGISAPAARIPQLDQAPRAPRQAINLPATLADPSASDALPPNQPLPLAARVTGDRVFLRTAPDVNAEPIDQFDTGTPARITESRGSWRRITIDGLVGWMFSIYLEIVEETPP